MKSDRWSGAFRMSASGASEPINQSWSAVDLLVEAAADDNTNCDNLFKPPYPSSGNLTHLSMEVTPAGTQASGHAFTVQ